MKTSNKPTKVLIQFENIEHLHPDIRENIDAELVGSGTNKQAHHLNYIKKEGEFNVYQFGPQTTLLTIEHALVATRIKYPQLKIIYNYL